jgi:plastocyanin
MGRNAAKHQGDEFERGGGLNVRARRGGWAAVLLAGAAGVGPLLWVTAGPAWAFTAPVKIAERAGSNEFEFAPTVVTIDIDDKVLWTNKSGARHTVTSDAGSVRFDSGQIPAGGQWERRFTTAGTFTYHCEVHPDMVGRIEVGSPAPTTTAPPPTTTTAPPTTTTTASAPTTTEPPTTTTTAPRPAAGPPAQPLPPVPSSAAAPPPTLATSSTTTTMPSTTTTSAPPPTDTTAPPTLPGEGETVPPTSAPEAPPTTAGPDSDTGDEVSSAAGPTRRNGGALDLGAVMMVSALVAVGVFAAWTLIRVRPGRV